MNFYSPSEWCFSPLWLALPIQDQTVCNYRDHPGGHFLVSCPGTRSCWNEDAESHRWSELSNRWPCSFPNPFLPHCRCETWDPLHSWGSWQDTDGFCSHRHKLAWLWKGCWPSPGSLSPVVPSSLHLSFLTVSYPVSCRHTSCQYSSPGWHKPREARCTRKGNEGISTSRLEYQGQ